MSADRPAIRLLGWSVGVQEPGRIRLSGRVEGDPRRSNGRLVITSFIDRVEGRRITTVKGTVYELIGDPDPEYLAFLESLGDRYDPENPIRQRGGGRG